MFLKKVLNEITEVEEDRLLTQQFCPPINHTTRCFLQVLFGVFDDEHFIFLENRFKRYNIRAFGSTMKDMAPWYIYDRMCNRWTTEKVNTMIRNKILRNRLNRSINQRQLTQAGSNGLHVHA